MNLFSFVRNQWFPWGIAILGGFSALLLSIISDVRKSNSKHLLTATIPTPKSDETSSEEEKKYNFVVHALKNENEEHMRGALDILVQNSTFTTHQDRMKDLGIIALLQKNLNETRSRTTASKIALILSNIAINPKNAVEFEKQQILQTFFRKCKYFPELQEDALQTLQNVTIMEDFNSSWILESRSIEFILPILGGKNEKSCKMALGVLNNIRFNELCKILIIKNCLTSIKILSNSQNPEIESRANHLIQILSEENEL